VIHHYDFLLGYVEYQLSITSNEILFFCVVLILFTPSLSPFSYVIGLFWATFYHFYVHDTEGPIGEYLRHAVDMIPWIPMKMDNRMFAILVVSISNQIVGILQMGEFLGPGFSPFVSAYNLLFPRRPSPAAKKIMKDQQQKKKNQ